MCTNVFPVFMSRKLKQKQRHSVDYTKYCELRSPQMVVLKNLPAAGKFPSPKLMLLCSPGELSGSWFGRYHRTQRMVHELFYKMPPSLLPAVVQQVADFVLGLSSAQGTMDAGAFVMTSAEMLPGSAIEVIMTPVIKLLREDAETLKGMT